MTAIVGILCKDGVVIGADSSATFSAGTFRTIEQPTDKIEIIGGSVIVAGTGSVGLGQRFHRIVEKAWTDKAFKEPMDVAKQLSQSGLKDMRETFLNPGQLGVLAAFPCKKKPYLCEFAINDFQPEFKTTQLWYCSMGSGQMITDPFLAFMREVFWQDGPPPLADGIFAATWTLEHVVSHNTGGVNGPTKLAILETTTDGECKARCLDPEEIDLHRQNVDAAKEHLRQFRQQHQPSAVEVPTVPKP